MVPITLASWTTICLRSSNREAGHPERKRQDERQQTERGAYRRTDRAFRLALLRLPAPSEPASELHRCERQQQRQEEESWYWYLHPLRSRSPPLTAAIVILADFASGTPQILGPPDRTFAAE